MSIERFFVFMYPEDVRLRDLLDLAVYILNPDEKWPAHITLAGPYNQKLSLPRKREYKAKISTLGVGEFRSSNQNTVFLRVGGIGLENHWDKPDFRASRFSPHITLYDGQDVDFADRLRDALNDIRIFFFFYVSKLEIVTSIKGQASKTLETVVNFSATAQTSKLTPTLARSLGKSERIEIATDVLKKAKYYMSV